jgi:DNA-binding NarL/FixJ family response regulator
MTNVVLADDHAVARQCLAGRIRAEAGLTLLAEATDGYQALGLARQHEPDVLLAAVGLPGMSGFDLAREARTKAPRTRVVLFAAPLRETYALEALRLGVAGYVLRSAGSSELLEAVREAAAGRRYISPLLSSRQISASLRRLRPGVDSYESLTPREREVLRLAVDGLTNPRIAERLGISRRTAETHRANVLRKLGLSSQTDLILFALRRGILPIEWDGNGSEGKRGPQEGT